MKKLTFVLIIILSASLLYAVNETPGQRKQPHRFSAFSGAGMDFGDVDIAIVKFYVCMEQHFTQGSIYKNNTLNNSMGSTGPWNFLKFISDKNADFMLICTHGASDTSLDVALFPHPAGQATWDSVWNYYNGVFPAGTLRRGLATYSGQRRYYISVTQSFFTRYLMTPQAILWGAFCYSSYFSATGSVEARDYLCYGNTVTSGKCNCDQRYILRRMDGWYGQHLRPLSAAFGGVNGSCAGTPMIRRGAGNTVLSPSVLENVPTGIVCDPTPGWVTFDTNMDTDINPRSVVIATGDGYLDNHRWTGLNRIDYDVIPTRSNPNIAYRVIESKAKGRADNARLDGNTIPNGINAFGPNRDDYIWATTCPYCPITRITVPPPPDTFWVTPPDSYSVPPTTTTPPVNIDHPVTITVINGLTTPAEVFIDAVNPDIEIEHSAFPVVLHPDTVLFAHFNHKIPNTIGYGFYDTRFVVYINDELHSEFTTTIAITDPNISATVLDIHNGMPGDTAYAEILLTNDFSSPYYVAFDLMGGSWDYYMTPEMVEIPADSFTVVTLVGRIPPGEIIGIHDSCRVAFSEGEVPIVPLDVMFQAMPTVSVHSISELEPFLPGESQWMRFTVSNNTERPENFELQFSTSKDAIIDLFPPVKDYFLEPSENREDSILITINPPEDISAEPDDYYGETEVIFTHHATEDFLPIIIERQGITIQPNVMISQLADTFFPAPVGLSEITTFEIPFQILNMTEDEGLYELFATVSDAGIEVSIEPNTMEFMPGMISRDAILQIHTMGPIPVNSSFDITVTISRMGEIIPLVCDKQDINVRFTSSAIISAPLDREGGIVAGDTATINFGLVNLLDVDLFGTITITDSLGWVIEPSVPVEIELPPYPAESFFDVFVIADETSPLGTRNKITLQLVVDPPITPRPSEPTMLIQADTMDYHINIIDATTSISDRPTLPSTFEISRVYPNPFNSAVNIEYSLSGDGIVELSCYNLLGRKISTIVDAYQKAGKHNLFWSPGDNLSSGIYYLRLRQGDKGFTHRLLYMK